MIEHHRGGTQFHVYLDIESFEIHKDHKGIVCLPNFKHQIIEFYAGDNNNKLLNHIPNG